MGPAFSRGGIATYRIGVVGSRNRLWLDDKLMVDDFVLHDPKPTTATIQLEKGHRYALKLEYGQGGTGTKLVWLPILADPAGEAVSAAKQATWWVAVVG